MRCLVRLGGVVGVVGQRRERDGELGAHHLTTMPPFDPRAHARLVGSLLGLTEGADGPFKFHIQPGAYEKLVEAVRRLVGL